MSDKTTLDKLIIAKAKETELELTRIAGFSDRELSRQLEAASAAYDEDVYRAAEFGGTYPNTPVFLARLQHAALNRLRCS